MNKDEIKELLSYYKTEYYAGLKNEQRIDQKYYDDKFDVPWITAPLVVSRTGNGAKIIDEPVEQISAASMMAFRDALKTKDGKEVQTSKDSAVKVSALINSWIARMMKQNPNPKHEWIKDMFLRGESWIHPIHNMKWMTTPFNKTELPVKFFTPDPLIIYASPNEDENGIPEHVFVVYERSPFVVKALYPDWNNPQNKQTKDTITWIEYISAKERYWEADGQPTLQGEIQPNIYGFVPYVHKIAPWGKTSPDGKPEDTIQGRLRKLRDLLNRDAASTSDIDSIIHLYANSPIIVTPQEGKEIEKDFADKFVWAAGNIIENPSGHKIERPVDLLPDAQVLAWHDRIEYAMGKETPTVLSGAPVGNTGRLQDMTYSTAMRKFESVVDSFCDAWSTTFSMALKMCDKLPSLMPEEIDSNDLKENYEVRVELRSDDPIEAARLSADGDKKFQMGIIDDETNLIEYQGKSQKRAQEIMAKKLVDLVMRTDPLILQAMAMTAVREAGLEDEYNALKEQAAQPQGKGANPVPKFGSEGGEPRTGNIQSSLGMEQADLMAARPARSSPNEI
jgi:hypothetical protein